MHMLKRGDVVVATEYYETTITGDTPSGSANNVDHVTTLIGLDGGHTHLSCTTIYCVYMYTFLNTNMDMLISCHGCSVYYEHCRRKMVYIIYLCHLAWVDQKRRHALYIV